MKITKKSNLVRNNILDENSNNLIDELENIDNDLSNLFLMAQGRVRFGTGDDGDRGENIHGEFQVYTSNGSADTEDAVAHTLGSVPIGFIVLNQDKGGVVYDSGTAWTATNIYLKNTVATVATTIFILK